MYGFLSHLHSLVVAMSQKSSVPQAAKSVSQALMSDTPPIADMSAKGNCMNPLGGHAALLNEYEWAAINPSE
jgi:hypothetical protein